MTGSVQVQGTLVPEGQGPTPAKKPVPDKSVPLPNEPAPPSLPGPSTTPAVPAMPTTPEVPLPKTTSVSSENSGVLTVWVPYDAKVTVNGHQTKSTGSRRQFVSFGLQAGLSYKYVVKAEVAREGQVYEETRTINLTAGQITAVAFSFNTLPTEQVADAR
jgi:uncharacterized protein (TIGR03000 family)